jgi:hypothetical protein
VTDVQQTCVDVRRRRTNAFLPADRNPFTRVARTNALAPNRLWLLLLLMLVALASSRSVSLIDGASYYHPVSRLAEARAIGRMLPTGKFRRHRVIDGGARELLRRGVPRTESPTARKPAGVRRRRATGQTLHVSRRQDIAFQMEDLRRRRFISSDVNKKKTHSAREITELSIKRVG